MLFVRASKKKWGDHASSTCSMTWGKRLRRGLLWRRTSGDEDHVYTTMKRAWELASRPLITPRAPFVCVNYAANRFRAGTSKWAKIQRAPGANHPHPDVRRMLLGMKAYVEGMRSFVDDVGQCLDQELATDAEEREFFKGFGDSSTPLVKAYCAQRGFDVGEAVQVSADTASSRTSGRATRQGRKMT